MKWIQEEYSLLYSINHTQCKNTRQYPRKHWECVTHFFLLFIVLISATLAISPMNPPCMYVDTVGKCLWEMAQCDNATAVWLTFMSCGCANTDHSTVWAKACGCQSARALWCHQWNCQSTPSPAVRRTCWLLKIQGRSGQSNSTQRSARLVARETMCSSIYAVCPI